MELISRDEAIKQIDEAFDVGGCYCDKYTIRGILRSLPTIEERKEGHWGYEYKPFRSRTCMTGFYICSECHTGIARREGDRPSNYCPNCGARMKGE